ncbi:MAG: SUMF1/EgtB/PvdO family nonheme iron enzyme [Candidatus Sumerlaeia bacterium]|nr:SUMF1/EgtB/PvdO family nonheme iron enzyme [Candidatus Sumerlaeia bacterium]
MKPIRLFLSAVAALALPAALLAAPVVTNVGYLQQPNGSGSTRVRVTYDLASPNGPATVSLQYSMDGGTSISNATTTTGDVGAGVTPGTGKTIDWAVATDLPGQQLPANFVVFVLAEDGVAIPLEITSNGGAVHQLGTQTLTFTFVEPVTGFDATDVTVTNGTKGAFAGSGAVYTLDVTSPGGTVTASVAASAAASVATGTASAAATFSNFYQDTWTITLPGAVPMELIRIPGGTFTMGSPVTELSREVDPALGGDLEAQYEVTLSEDYYMAKTELTQQQWLAIQAFPRAQGFVDATMPVHNIVWGEVQTWLAALNANQGPSGVFRMPTEAQWERACRAGTTTRFSYGDGLHPLGAGGENCETTAERVANMWYCGNDSPNGTKVVAQLPANPWGLHDMHGNVIELCQDWFGVYPAGPVTDPTGGPPATYYTARGGSWQDGAQYARSALRWAIPPNLPSSSVGTRVAATRPVTLVITSTQPAAVHQSAAQTLTFTFGEPVTGFDTTDVTVTNATRGTFTPVSSTVYTLDITSAGGKIDVSVPANAATETSAFAIGTAAATFSNFYQDTWTITLPGSVPMELIRIPAGTFTMGSPSGETSRGPEETQHTVTLSQDFYLGKTEVTQAQWLAIYGVFPSGGQDHGTGAGSETRAVHRVSHNDIMDASTGFMKLLNDHITATVQGPATATLPTESQWEYAARAGTTTRFNFGDGLSTDEDCATGGGRETNMWYCGNNSPNGTKLVGQKPANAWGLRDMHGNVWEWCSDWYDTYPGTVTDPTGPGSGSVRVLRGASWVTNARNCRSAQRNTRTPTHRSDFIGFRVLAVRPMPLTITSSETAPVHQTATQTLTFTFDSAVSDFDADDVTLTGATKGTFTPVSSTVYTLDITGTGGKIDVSVPANAATETSAFAIGTAAATFSNFYQDTWTITLPGSVAMELIRIPAGTFTMGSPAGPTPPAELSRGSDEVQRTITLTQDFYLGKTEVTQNQWVALQSFPQAQSFVGGTMPVHNVSHNDIGSWMTALNTHVTEPGTFSLPTEAQWEYACRAATTTRFNFGDGFSANEFCSAEAERTDNMWYCGNNSPNGTKVVGQKPANAWGLRDMHGNVWEWCADWYGAYDPLETENPDGPASGSARVFRGGGWLAEARSCRSAQRNGNGPSSRGGSVGFRVLAVR